MASLILNPDRSAVRVWGEDKRLSPLEFKLLEHLLNHAGKLVSRDDLLVQVWGYKPGVNTRAVDNTLRRLRQKLGPEQGWTLSTVYGGGYLLEMEPERSLPSRPGPILGRSALIEALLERCSQAGSLTTLLGPGGIGKTSVALELAWTLAEPPLWVELEPTQPGALRGTLAATLGVAESALEQSWADHRGLVILDNGEHLVPELVAWLEQPGPQSVLLTSRVPLELPREQRVPVPPFEPAQALSYYRSRVALNGQAMPPDVQALARSLDAVDRLPLAVGVLASLAPLLPSLDTEHDSALLTLPVSPALGSRHDSLGSVVAWSWSLLTPSQRHQLCLLSSFRDTFSPQAAAAVLELSAPETAACLSGLAKASLIELDSERARLYQAIRELARSHQEDSHRQAFLRWALQLAQTQLWTTPFGEDWNAVSRELPDLQQAMELCEDPSQRLTLGLIWTRWRWRSTPIHPLVRELEDHISAAQGQHGAPLVHAALLMSNLTLNAGKTEQCLRWLEQVKDPSPIVQGKKASILGSYLRSTGNIAGAISALERAIQLLEGRDPYEHFRALIRLAVVVEHSTGPQSAEPILWRAVQAARELENPYAHAMVAAQIGSNLSIQGRCREAAEALRQGIEECPGLPYTAALNLNLSMAHLGMGNFAQAEVALRRAEGIARRKGDRSNQSMALNNLGTLLLLQEQPIQAKRSLKLAQATQPGLHRAGVMAQGNLGILALLFEDLETGLRLLLDAVPDCETLGLHQASACYSTFAAVALHLLGRGEEADQTFQATPKLKEPGIQKLQEQAQAWLSGQGAWRSLREGDDEDLRLLYLLRERRGQGS